MRRRLLGSALVVVGLMVGLTTRHRTQLWTDERALWADAVQKAPAKPRPWVNLGRQAALRGAVGGARRAYWQALIVAQAPGRSAAERLYGSGYAQANLALLLMAEGNREDAHAVIADAHRAAQRDTGAIPAVVQQAYTWIVAPAVSP